MGLDGIHHVTAITRRRAAGDRLPRRRARPAAGEDDGQLRRARHVPPLHRRRDRARRAASSPSSRSAGRPPGRAGAGMVHRIIWRVPSADALDVWAAASATPGGRWSWRRRAGDLRPGGPRHRAGGRAARGRRAARGAAARRPARARARRASPACAPTAGRRRRRRRCWWTGSASRDEGGGRLRPPAPSAAACTWSTRRPEDRPVPGAGTVHHVAWTSPDAEHAGWIDRVRAAGGHPTGVIDRQYFRSIYFHEPGGVLFEIATVSPGFAVDEARERLGEALRLPPAVRAHRDGHRGAADAARHPRARDAPRDDDRHHRGGAMSTADTRRPAGPRTRPGRAAPGRGRGGALARRLARPGGADVRVRVRRPLEPARPQPARPVDRRDGRHGDAARRAPARLARARRPRRRGDARRGARGADRDRGAGRVPGVVDRARGRRADPARARGRRTAAGAA